MRTVTGLFDTSSHAASAVDALRDVGIASDDISIVANNASGEIEHHHAHDEGGGAATGAGLGVATGGGIGLLAGLGALAIPGIGPVVAGGWLLTTAVGAAIGLASGSIVGALLKAGVSEEDAHVYAEGVRRGGALVTARVDDARADSANAILRNAQGVDVAARRDEYKNEGWSAFDENRTDVYSPGAPFIPPGSELGRN
ncbi:MAG: hypothetical protein ABIQ30_11865 [Devosia sp.]